MSLSSHYEPVPLSRPGQTPATLELIEAYHESLDDWKDDFTIVDSEFVDVQGIQTPRIRHAGIYEDIKGDIGIVVTDCAADRDKESTIFLFPGYTESPTVGLASEVHKRVADRNQASRVVSFATDGLSQYCPQRSLKSAGQTNLHTMAGGRLRAMEALGNDTKIEIWGDSMGTVIATDALARNVSEERIKVEDVVYHSTGVMTPDAARAAMLMEFMPSIMIDGTLETIQHPLRTARNIGVRPELLHPKTWAALGNQALQILHGTQRETIESAVSHNNIGLIVNPADPLYDEPLWTGLQEAYPDHLRVRELPRGTGMLRRGQGHLVIMDDWQVAADMQKMSHELQASSE